MADVLPFAAVRYNAKEKNLDLSKVVAPPYDVITAEMQQALYERHPNNIVRLDYGKIQPNDDDFNNRYTRAAALIQQWKTEEILVTEKKRCYYAYEQKFHLPGLKDAIVRRGVFGLVRLMDYRSGRVRAHEKTFQTPKLDRLKLLRATQFNLSPVFVLFSDPEKAVAKALNSVFTPSGADVISDEDGITHSLWTISKKETVLAIREAFKNKNLCIADGHHRYETCLAYRDEMRDLTGRKDGRQPFDYIMMYLSDFDDEGVVILPTHRILAREYGLDVNLEEVLEDLGEYFQLKEFHLDLGNLDEAATKAAEKLKPPRGNPTRMVMILPSGRGWVLTLKKDADLDDMIDEDLRPEVKALDVTLLHRYVIARGWIGNPEVELEEGDITYEHNIPAALDLLRRRKGCVAFLTNPTTKKQVQQIAELGELMPPKSTQFYPKLATGLLLRDLTTGFE